MMKSKNNKKILMIIGVAVALIAAAGVIFMGGAGEKEPEVTGSPETTQQTVQHSGVTDYIIAEDTENIFLIDLGSAERERKVIDTVRGEDEYRDSHISTDKNKILFKNNMQYDDNFFYVYELMLYDIENDSLVKLCDKATSYAFNADFSDIIYLDARDSKVYRYTSQGKETLFEDAVDFICSENLKTVICEKDDGSAYIMSEGSEPEFIDEMIDRVLAYNSDCTEIVYNRENALIRYDNGEKTVLSEAFDYQTGEWYTYDKGLFFELSEEKTLESFVEDDLKGKALTDKEQRIKTKIERALRSESMTMHRLCFYEGNETDVVLEDVIYSYSEDVYSGPMPEITVHCVADKKIKMSELVQENVQPDMLGTYIYDTIVKRGDVTVVKNKDVICNVAMENMSTYVYDKVNSVLYLRTHVTDDSGNAVGENYMLDLKNAGEIKPVPVGGEMVSDMNLCYLLNGNLITFSDENDKSFVYCNGEKFFEYSGYMNEVSENMIMAHKPDGETVFYDGKEMYEVEGVGNYELFDVTSDGRIVFYQDYKYSVSIVEKDGTVSLMPDIYKFINFPRNMNEGFEIIDGTW